MGVVTSGGQENSYILHFLVIYSQEIWSEYAPHSYVGPTPQPRQNSDQRQEQNSARADLRDLERFKSSKAKEILLTWREEAPKISMTKLGNNDFIFGYEKKPSFTYCAFRDRVNDYLIRQAGSIDKIRLHRCRHTVATLLVAEDRKILQIMQQLGITEEKTLQRYVDEPGNQKIITGNVDAISKGLSDMVSRADKKATDDSTTIELILMN